MKIGVFTTFYNLDSGYSLCSVVHDQLEGLVRHGYEPVLFTLPNFQDERLVPKGVEIRKIVPQLILEPYKGLEYPSHWKEDVRKARESIEKNCADITLLICHDIFFIDTYLPYNIALREANISARFFGWTHSAPSNRPDLENNPHSNRFVPHPRLTLVYLNHDKALDLAEMYGMWLKDVRVVHNARDPRSFWTLHDLTRKLIDQYDLLSADILSVYPLSTPRMISGKGLSKVIKLHSKLKQLGYSTHLVVCNAHANGHKEKRLIADTKVWAEEQGVLVIFTSQIDEEWEMGVPNEVVSDLFRLSNVFIFPTASENSSLVLIEAMLAGNLLVLNKEVGTLREHAGENALYFDFNYREPQEENENYYLDLAKIISSELKISKPLMAKRRALQKHNIDAIFKNELEPILYENRDE